MRKHYPRYFIGLDLEPSAKLAIEQWRHKYLAGLPDKPVPMENFHVTLAFLGAIPPDKHEQLERGLDKISAQAFSSQTTELGWFKKAKVLYLGLALTPEFERLAQACRLLNKELQVPQHHSHFKPHITLFRNHREAVPLPTQPLKLNLTFHQFHLFESVSNAQMGKPPHYPKRQTYDLAPQFSRG